MQNGNRFIDMTVKSQLLNNLFFLSVCILACTPIVPFLAKRFEKMRGSKAPAARLAVSVYDIVTAVIPIGLLLLSVLALVGNSYNPFLYFRF